MTIVEQYLLEEAIKCPIGQREEALVAKIREQKEFVDNAEEELAIHKEQISDYDRMESEYDDMEREVQELKDKVDELNKQLTEIAQDNAGADM